MSFEIVDNNSCLKIEPIKLMFPDSESERDRNMILAQIVIRVGGFQGNYNAEIMTTDFEQFKQELSWLYNDLKGSATFNCIERYLTMIVVGDGLGHFTVDCIAVDTPGIYGNELRFQMHFDQTQINGLVSQLDLITKGYK